MVKMSIKLNIGCGEIRPIGWDNLDSSLNANLQRLPFLGKYVTRIFRTVKYDSSNVKYMNVNNRWPYKDNSVDIVYASHLFEHLNLKTANYFLTEAYRVLKKGGVIRIVVPDLYQIAKKYVNDYEKCEDIKDTTNYIMWAINMHREGQYGNPNLIKRIIYEIQGYPHQHKYMYDVNSLSLKMITNNFTQLSIQSYGKSDYINDINLLEGKSESYLSVYLDAKKQ